MEDLFKKFLYTGIGLVALTAEKIQTTVDDLVNQSKISEEEGKKLVEDFLKDTEAKKEEFETKLKEVTEDVVEKFDFLRADALETLQERIALLEDKLGIKKEEVEDEDEEIDVETEVIEEEVVEA